MIGIVCGGRDYSNAARVMQILDAAVLRLGLHTIIEGECPTDVNADKLAAKWAEDRGDISVIKVPAETRKGKFLGAPRNQMMLTMLLRADEDIAVFAFPGGRGTWHMCKIATKAGVRIITVDHKFDREAPPP